MPKKRAYDPAAHGNVCATESCLCERKPEDTVGLLNNVNGGSKRQGMAPLRTGVQRPAGCTKGECCVNSLSHSLFVLRLRMQN